MAKARAGHSTVSRAIGGAAGWRGRFDRVRQHEAWLPRPVQVTSERRMV